MKSDQIPRIGYDPVQRFISRLVHDPHLAADLTADVFLAVIDNAASYDPRRGDPAAWLHGIVRNVVSGEHRRVARTQKLQERIEGSSPTRSQGCQRPNVPCSSWSPSTG
jgi:RNA polymerase sigma-70 factor (ECF subfamily)